MQDSFIKIWRKLPEWEWYTEPNTMRVFLHLLVTVNFKDKPWKGDTIKAGETARSIYTIAAELNIGVQSVRTAMKNLEHTGEVTFRKIGKHRITTIENWSNYNGEVHESTQKSNTMKNASPNTMKNEKLTQSQKNKNGLNKTKKSNKNEKISNSQHNENEEPNTMKNASPNTELTQREECKESNINIINNNINARSENLNAGKADILSEFDKFILFLNQKNILGSQKVKTAKAEKKWIARRRTYSAREILNAFLNLLNERDLWKIRNNGFRPIAWWLHSDERIEEMLNCHRKGTPMANQIISDEYGNTPQT